jgi:hypothetical protein
MGTGVAEQVVVAGAVVAEELQEVGGMNVSSPNPRWMSALAVSRRSLA